MNKPPITIINHQEKNKKQKGSPMRIPITILSGLALFSLSACGHDDHDDHHDHDHENEVITTVILSFTATTDGSVLVFEADDPDGDGGDAPTIDDVMLVPGSYDLAISFENRLEDPAEDITEEIEHESDEHQIFFTGTAVNGPAADNPGAPLDHSYADTDAEGKPIGLVNRVNGIAGTGDLIVTLRHLPPINDAVSKVSDLAAQVRASGPDSIEGSSDAQVTFPVVVQ